MRKRSVCDPDVFESGETIFVIVAESAKIIEAIVLTARDLVYPSAKIDWYYMGGRGVVKAMGDIEAAREAIERCLSGIQWMPNKKGQRSADPLAP